MTDQCQHCTHRGNPQACLASNCFKHEDWITVTLRADLTRLRAEYVECQKKLAAAEAARDEARRERDALLGPDSARVVAIGGELLTGGEIYARCLEERKLTHTHKARADAACELLRETVALLDRVRNPRDSRFDLADHIDAFLASPGGSGGETKPGCHDYDNLMRRVINAKHPDEAEQARGGKCPTCGASPPKRVEPPELDWSFDDSLPSEGGAR